MASTAVTAVDSLFTKSLSTMVKGIRSTRDKAQADYIAKCLIEIKKELKSNDADDKQEALRKLMYLQLMEYDMSWAAFHIIEVMSLTWIGHRKIGYLAASLCFNQSTDVSLLATNLFKKSFSQSQSSPDPVIAEGIQYDVGSALNCFANICTPALANDLLNDVISLLNSTRPYIRKKAVLALLQIFVKYPPSLHMAFERVTDKLGDDSPAVVSSVVYVLCELAARSPKNYLGLAPQFFQILTTSSNNWVLIKVVKLLGSLVPLEPRLAKKLTEPLVEIINTTPAKSLMFECINTLLLGQITSKSVVRLCLDKLREFIEASDQNLKYLGLLGLHKLIQSFPRVVVEHKDLILTCLDDPDITLRMRALDLVGHLVTPRNLAGVVRRLVDHLHNSEGYYRDVILAKILAICSQDNFSYVADFEWYLVALLDLTRIPGASKTNALTIKNQIVDLLVRVPDLRPFGTSQLCSLLLDGKLLKEVSAAAATITTHSEKVSKHSLITSTLANHNHMSEVLAAAAFCIGEYAQYSHSHVRLLSTLLLHPSVPSLSPAVQAAFVQAVPKVLAVALSQPFFDTADEAKAWELAQKAAVNRAKERADALKTESILPSDVEDPFALNDSDSDSDDDDELMDDSKLQITAVGHCSYVGRTAAQHCFFVEQVFTVCLTGLKKLSISPHMEVQERAGVSGQYMEWIVAQLGPMCKINPNLLSAHTKSSGTDSTSNETVESVEDNEEDEAVHAEKERLKEKEKESEKEKKASALVDLTDLLFGTDNTDINMFDPLSLLINPSPASSPASPSIKPATPPTASEDQEPVSPSVSERTVDPEYMVKIQSLPILFSFLHAEPLVPVGSKAQRRVPVPNGLDLDEVFFEEDVVKDKDRFYTPYTHPLFPIGTGNNFSQSSKSVYYDDSDSDDVISHSTPSQTTATSSTQFILTEDTEQEKLAAKKRLEARQKAIENDPYYIGSQTTKKKKDERKVAHDDIDIDLKEVGRKTGSKRMNILGDDSDGDDDDLFEGSSLAVSNKKEKKKKEKEKEKESEKSEKVAKKKEKKGSKRKNVEPEVSLASGTDPMPTGIALLHADSNLSVHVQARPVAQDSGDQPTLLLAFTVTSTPQIPMMQLSIMKNKKAQGVVPSIPQPTPLSQCIIDPTNSSLLHIQAKNIPVSSRLVCYASLQWDSNNISTSSLQFQVLLKYISADNTPCQTPLTLTLPIASFILPEKITMAQFQHILTHDQTKCVHSVVHSVSTQDVVSVLKGIEYALNVQLVEAANMSAGYYGRCSIMEGEEAHVCVYVKSGNDSVVVNIKTSSEHLSKKLVNDLKRVFG